MRVDGNVRTVRKSSRERGHLTQGPEAGKGSTSRLPERRGCRAVPEGAEGGGCGGAGSEERKANHTGSFQDFGFTCEMRHY